ncbi:MAG: heavy metal translocating P-type ATPase [Breznakia sp.]
MKHKHNHRENVCTCNRQKHEHIEHECAPQNSNQSSCHCDVGPSEATPSSDHLEDENDQRFQYKIIGLDCASCANKIEAALLQDENIQQVYLNFSSGKISIYPNKSESEMDDKVLLKKINSIVNRVEPGVQVLPEKAEISNATNHRELIKIGLSLLLLMVAIYIEKQSSLPPMFFFVIAYVIVGYDVLKTSLLNILKGDVFDENFLMSIATIGAFIVGSYKEAVAVMLFYSLGEYFQSLAVNKSRRSIADLMDIKSNYANVIRDGKEKRVDPSELIIGDLISVRVGEKVPVDGIIVSGSTALDVAALSGESLLRDVHVNDEVLAGSINKSGVIQIEVQETFENSTVAKILELVENAASKKAPIENFITKFAKVYTPFVVLLAIGITFIPPLIFGFAEFNLWLYRGCTFLVISCPCALIVSVPLGVFAGIGSASRIGVLVKGGNYLELLGSVNHVVMDKTGTITKGNFKVMDISNAKVLEYAAYAEVKSNHPIAKSIISAYEGNLDQTRITAYEEMAGYGIKAILDQKELLAGNFAFMEKENITSTKIEALGSVVYVAYDHQYIGYIVVGDELKPTSKQAIKKLREQGVEKSVMLSGDRQVVADEIAKLVGIDEVYAELLPQDKVEILESYLQSEDHVVAFIGDGINDAPALVRADIGISMGGVGSDVAIEASDIVLMSDDLALLPKALKISRYTIQIVTQNIVFSLAVKGIVLFLSAFGIANMWMGVFADVGVTLLAILNSMRIFKIDNKL